MDKFLIAALLIVASSAAIAQAPTITQSANETLAIVPAEGPTKFFWLRIAACAKDEKHPHYAYCRSWIDAREEGKKER